MFVFYCLCIVKVPLDLKDSFDKTNQKGQALHDKVTRGEHLSSEEQRELQNWYDEQGQEEMASTKLPKSIGTLLADLTAKKGELLKEQQDLLKKILGLEDNLLVTILTLLSSSLQSQARLFRQNHRSILQFKPTTYHISA